MNNTEEKFFSMNRLMEFGVGMAMSQQIVKSMNGMMESIRQPKLVSSVFQPLSANPAQNAQPNYQQYAGQQVSQNPAAFSNAAKTAEASPLSEVFYISRESGKSEGPYSGTEIARLVAEKKVTAKTPVWKPAMSEWKTAADFPDLLALIALVPPEVTVTKE